MKYELKSADFSSSDQKGRDHTSDEATSDEEKKMPLKEKNGLARFLPYFDESSSSSQAAPFSTQWNTPLVEEHVQSYTTPFGAGSQQYSGAGDNGIRKGVRYDSPTDEIISQQYSGAGDDGIWKGVRYDSPTDEMIEENHKNNPVWRWDG
jgi:hypothetical protein